MSTDELDGLFGRWRGQRPPAEFAPAPAVRRRGRQRARRQAMVAGLAVLAVLGLGAGSLVTIVTGPDPDQDPVAPAATATAVPEAIAPQWLLTADDLGPAPDWQQTPTELLEGDWLWQAECDGDYQADDYPSLAHRQDVAVIGWESAAGPVRVDQLVELFDSAAAAAANLDDIRAVIARCSRLPRPGDEVAPTDHEVVEADFAADGSLLVEERAYYFDEDAIAPDPVVRYLAVVQVGAVVTTLVSQEEDLLREVAPRAAARLPAEPGNPPSPPPPPAVPTGCTVEQLPVAESWATGSQPTRSLVTAADPTGSLITGRGYPDSALPDFVLPLAIWRDGEPEFLAGPDSGTALEAINSSGVAVGTSWGEPTLPWIYQDGELSPLPGVESGQANGINERGDVAGAQLLGEEVPGLPVWWPAGSSEPIALPLPAGAASGEALGIDEDSTIVGLYAVDGEEHPYVWFPDGTAGELPLPAGRSPSARAFHIRDGWVAGTVDLPGGGVRVVRWHLPSGEVREFPQFAGAPYAVNAAGWLVGSNADNKALLATGDGDVTLPGLADGWDHAVAISDDGRFLAGQSEDEAGDTHAVRWLCA